MGAMSIWHWLVVGAIALLLFGGKGKISELMGDVAKGIKSFKKGLQEEEQPARLESDTAKSVAADPNAAPGTIEGQTGAGANAEQQGQKAS